jgi:hypothetical protein
LKIFWRYSSLEYINPCNFIIGDPHWSILEFRQDELDVLWASNSFFCLGPQLVFYETSSFLETGDNRVNLLLRGNSNGDFRWEDIPVAVSGGRIIRLNEIVRPAYVEQQARVITGSMGSAPST